MSVTFRIMPEQALVLVRYAGLVRFQDGADIFDAYVAHPDRRAGFRHLVDFTEVTGIGNDYGNLFRMQARKAAVFLGETPPPILVYLAPTDVSRRLAVLMQRSWEGLGGTVVSLAPDRDAALEILGLRREVLDGFLSSEG
jgi:hypothetical protein